MAASTTTYELRGKALFVNGEHVGLSPGVVEAALVYYREETGKEISWNEEEPIPLPWGAVEKMLRLQKMLDLSRMTRAMRRPSA